MTIDIARARAETPGCHEVLHFNNAGASLPPAAVLAAVKGHLDLEARIGGYEAAEHQAGALENTYRQLARLFNATPDEVALVENATRAWDMAFYSLPFAPGDRILCAEAEYASNFIAFLQMEKRTGVQVEPVPSDSAGAISLEALEDMIDERVKLIALTHVPTNGGLVQPAAEVGRIANSAGVPYLLDACQSAGQMPLDVEAIGCDMLSATGRKFLRGPRGVGVLFVRRSFAERMEPAFLDLHSARWTRRDRFEIAPGARRFETWEGNIAGRIGLGVAVEIALERGLEAIRDRVVTLAAMLRERLRAIPGVTTHDAGDRKCGIVTFIVEGHGSEVVKRALAAQAVNIAVSPFAYSRLDMEPRGLPDLARASVHYYNTGEEVERFAAAVAEIAGGRSQAQI
jgi:selenocysteine lyase/cysteine desulfurase